MISASAKKSIRLLVSFCYLLIVVSSAGMANCQGIPETFTIPASSQTGTPEQGSFEGTMENINLQNGNVSIAIPLLHYVGVAGLDLDLKLLVNSKAWSIMGGKPPTYESDTGQNSYSPPGFGPSSQISRFVFGGGYLNIPALASSYVDLTRSDSGGMGTTNFRTTCNTGYTFYDSTGAAHGFNNFANCVGDSHPYNPEVNVDESNDGSFYRLDTSNHSDVVVYDRSGIQYHFSSPGGGMPVRIMDPSGNSINLAFSGYQNQTPTLVITDTVGSQVTITPTSITYNDSQGAQRVITLSSSNLANQSISFFYRSAKSTDGQYSVGSEQPSIFNLPATQDTLVFPSGEQFVLTYTAFHEISKIKYPAGGYTAYTYQNIPGVYLDMNWSVSADIREIQTKAVCANTGGSCSAQELATTTYTPSTGPNQDTDGNVSMEVSDPAGNVTHVDFAPVRTQTGTAIGLELQRQLYSGNKSTLLKTIKSEYANGSNGTNACFSHPTKVTTTLNDASPAASSRVEYDYQSITLNDGPNAQDQCGTSIQSSMPTAKREYGFDSSLIRTTTNSWSGYSNDGSHILDRLTSSTVSSSDGFTSTHVWDYDSNGVLKDETVGGTNVNDVITTYGRDSKGRLTSVKDGRQYTTIYDYTPAWVAANNCSPSNVAVPTKVTDALNHSSSATFDACTGTLHSTTNVNGNTSSFQYDTRMRRTDSSLPDGGGEHVTYSNGAGNPITTQTKLDGSRSITTVLTHDGLGRTAKTENQSAPEGTISAETGYDALGHVAFRSNPHLSSASADYISYSYDALGRMRYQCDQDNGSGSSCSPTSSYLEWVYSGNKIDSYDEKRNHSSRSYDSLGRLTDVYEPDSGGNADLHTAYQYNLWNRLTRVDQYGQNESTRSRAFTYDGASHLLTAENPETGTICYGVWSNSQCTGGYDNNGNVLKKTDQRSVTTSYTYDALNRLIYKSYSNGDRHQWYSYDGKDESGNNMGSPWAANSVGMLSHTSDSTSVASNYAYDLMGRLVQKADCTPGNCNYDSPQLASYNFAGDMIGLTYPSGRQVAFGYDNAGRLNGITGAGNSAGATYLSSMSYHADGSPATTVYGNGVTEILSENSRMQICEASAAGSGQTFLDRQYFYGMNNTSGQQCNPVIGNAGTILGINDGLGGSYSQNFSYDSLNRIKSWTAPNMAGSYRHLDYLYDSFGNIVQSSDGPNIDPRPFFVSSNRREPGSFNCYGKNGESGGYDAAGNQICSGTQNQDAKAYIWNAENGVAQVWGQQNNNTYYPVAQYLYDAQGQRVRSEQYNFSNTLQSWREYTYFNGQVIAERTDKGGWADYIYAHGRRIARVDNYGQRLALHGTRCNGCGSQSAAWDLPFAGYTVKSGDKVSWHQWQGGSAVGGLSLQFTDNSNTNWTTTDSAGVVMNNMTTTYQWIVRTVDLSPFAGKTVNESWIGVEGQTGPGDWDQLYADIAIYSTDGTVTPIYSRSDSYTLSSKPTSAVMSNLSWENQRPVAGYETGNIGLNSRFYVADQVGTTQMEFSGDGYPTWKGEFAPFGQELDTASTMNRYRFSGKERDAETGLDYFGARFYASGLGRWMSPDWSAKAEPVPYSRLEDPQTLNLYAFVTGNPVTRVDSDGHDCLGCRDIINAIMAGVPSGDALNQVNEAKRQAQQQNTTATPIPSSVAAIQIPPQLVEKAEPLLDKGLVAVEQEEPVVAQEAVTVYQKLHSAYVGITNNVARRQAQHGEPLAPIVQGLSRLEAKGVEQAIILQRGLGNLTNKINSISVNNPVYERAVQFGKELLDSIGYKP